MPFIYDGTTDSRFFEFWFEEILLKTAPKGAVFVMDNATFHSKEEIVGVGRERSVYRTVFTAVFT